MPYTTRIAYSLGLIIFSSSHTHSGPSSQAIFLLPGVSQICFSFNFILALSPPGTLFPQMFTRAYLFI